jgi:acetyl esterase
MNGRGVVFGLLLWAGAADAQVSSMPQHVQIQLRAVGPMWSEDIGGNVERMLAVYTPILRAVPQDRLRVTSKVAYGPHERQWLDLYQLEGKTQVPIVVFIHGGAYVGGSPNVNEHVYGNVAAYFANQGMLGVNAGYRLAPAAPWPAGAKDVGAIVAWLSANGEKYGGDTSQIYLIGHSAGATHVAGYAFDLSLQPVGGPGVGGVILMSGRYRITPAADDPNLTKVQAYFGADHSQYPQRSAINHIENAKDFPVFIVIAEYDNPGLDTSGAELFAAFCQRNRACPRFTRMVGHNHLSMVYQFNTEDDALGREIIEFIRDKH